MGSGIGKKVLTALQRIDRAEGAIEFLANDRRGLLEAVNRSLAMSDDRFNVLEKCMNAVSDVVDKLVIITKNENVEAVDKAREALTDITSTLKRQLAEERQREANAEKAAIEMAVKAGEMVPVEVVDNTTVIVGREVNEDGSVTPPGWLQLMVGQAREDLKETLMGKKVGDTVPLGKRTFEIQELYTVVQKKPEDEVKQAEPGADVAGEGVAEEGPPVPPPATSTTEADADKALQEYLDEAEKNKPDTTENPEVTAAIENVGEALQGLVGALKAEVGSDNGSAN